MKTAKYQKGALLFNMIECHMIYVVDVRLEKRAPFLPAEVIYYASDIDGDNIVRYGLQSVMENEDHFKPVGHESDLESARERATYYKNQVRGIPNRNECDIFLRYSDGHILYIKRAQCGKYSLYDLYDKTPDSIKECVDIPYKELEEGEEYVKIGNMLTDETGKVWSKAKMLRRMKEIRDEMMELGIC